MENNTTQHIGRFLISMTLLLMSTVTVSISAPPGKTVFSARVVYGKQKPVQGCSVSLGQAKSQTITSADGRFSFYDYQVTRQKPLHEKTGSYLLEASPAEAKPAQTAIDIMSIDCPGFAPEEVEIFTYDEDAGDVKIKSPNIILILWDDLGYGEVSASPFGQTMFKTPGLDRLAAEGMSFTDFYAANAICSASRGGLMTGKHSGNATVRANLMRIPDTDGWRIGYLLENDTTVAQVMKKAEYHTALFGKWHLDRDDDLLTMPRNKGFDEVLRERWDKREHRESGYVKNYPFVLWGHGTPVYFKENRNAASATFLDDISTDYGLDFIQRHRDHSFFLFLSYKTPHSPIEYSGDMMALGDKSWPEIEKKYATRISQVDKNIDRLTDLLDELKISEHTLVLVTSDNGPHAEGGHDPEFFNSNGPFRGIKGELYEGGIRVPTLARWPGKIQAGTISRHPAAFWDLMATAADIAGVDAPANDGISFLPELVGEKQRKHPYLYWERHWREGNMARAMRMENWKAVQANQKSPMELFDLVEDISESNDISALHPEIVRRMESLMETASSPSPYYPLP